MPTTFPSLAVSPRPLASWFPSQGPDWGPDPSAIDPESLPAGWTPSGAALLSGSVNRDPVSQAQYNLQLGDLAEQANSRAQANQFFNGVQQLDTTTPEGLSGVERLASAFPLAAAHPAVAKYLGDLRQARQLGFVGGRNAPLDPGGERFLANLLTTDVTDPTAFQGVQSQLAAHPEWLRDPRVANQMERVFLQRQGAALKPPATARAGKYADSNLEDQMALSGISPDDIEAMRDDSGAVPRAQALYAISQAKMRDDRLPLPTQQKEQLVNLMSSISSPGDPAKQEAWETAHPGQVFDPKNAQHWSEGFRLASANAKKTFDQTAQDLHDTGFRLPGDLNDRYGGKRSLTSQLGGRYDRLRPGTPNPFGTPTVPPSAASPVRASANPPTDNITPIPSGPAQPGDLTQTPLYSPGPGTGFTGVQQQKDASVAASNQAAADEAVARAKLEAANVPLWEGAKQQLLRNFKPEYTNVYPTTYGDLVKVLLPGSSPDDVAFRDASGKAIAWRNVVNALMADPRMDKIRGYSQPAPATPPLPPGVKVTVRPS